MARNIHQRLSKFTTRLLILLKALHDSGEATIRTGYEEVFRKES